MERERYRRSLFRSESIYPEFSVNSAGILHLHACDVQHCAVLMVQAICAAQALLSPEHVRDPMRSFRH
jgi:hypothetical protein